MATERSVSHDKEEAEVDNEGRREYTGFGNGGKRRVGIFEE
jgi:hypothetical protein